MKKIILVTLMMWVLMTGRIFSQEPTTQSHLQTMQPTMAIHFSNTLPSQDSLEVPQDILIKSWVWMVMNYVPEEKADTNSYSVYKYTNDVENGQFFLMHSHETQHNYYFYFSPPDEIFRLSQFIEGVGQYDEQALQDSAYKYIPGFN